MSSELSGKPSAADAEPLRDLSHDQMQEILRQTEQYVLGFLDRLPFEPADGTADGRRLAAEAATARWPDRGEEFARLLEVIAEKVVPPSYSTAGGGYLAYIPGGGLFPSAVADLIADVTNRYMAVATPAPAAVRIELDVLKWFGQMVGYPDTAAGTLTSGGSIANLTALICARVDRLGESFQDGVIYASTQAHHSVERAARHAGFRPAQIASLPVDDRFRMDLAALERQIAADRQKGRRPALIVANAGATNTGAVDPLVELAAIARREGLWLHVDAAYGGFFLLTGRGRQAMKGIELSDSVTLDPHKGLFLPYGTGSILVRDGKLLKKAMGARADYLQDLDMSEGHVNFHEISLEMSRDFRGLRVWLPLRMFGRNAFEATLDEKLDMTWWLYERLRKLDGLHFLEEPQLSILAFTARDNEASRRLMQTINASQRVLLSSTMIDGRYVVRVCILNFRTDWERIEQLAKLIEAAVGQL